MKDKHDQKQRVANLIAQLDQARSSAEDWRREAEELKVIIRRQANMADTLIQALEPLWQRARAPGAESAPDDATVTVFMKDCRAAFRAISGQQQAPETPSSQAP